MKCTNWSLIPALFLAAACGERGSGVFSFDSRQLSRFSEVENRGEVNLYLEVEDGGHADDGAVTVSGDDNLIGSVRTEVRGETLIVDTDYDVWPDLELRLVASVSRLYALDIDGSGDAHVHGINGINGSFLLVIDGSGDATIDGVADRFELQNSGSGDADLTGVVGELDVNTSGSGDVHARDLTANEASVRVSGSGDVEVCVTGALDAVTSGSGDIDYYCNPDVVYPSTPGSGNISGH